MLTKKFLRAEGLTFEVKYTCIILLFRALFAYDFPSANLN